MRIRVAVDWIFKLHGRKRFIRLQDNVCHSVFCRVLTFATCLGLWLFVWRVIYIELNGVLQGFHNRRLIGVAQLMPKPIRVMRPC